MRVSTIEELNKLAGGDGAVRARVERLLKRIGDWPPARRAEVLERLARTFADVIDLQSRQ